MDLEKVVLAGAAPQMRHGLDEGHTLDVANGSAQLNYAHVRHLVGVVDGDLRDLDDPVLDCIRDVRHDLHRLAQIVALALALDDMLVDLARGDVVLTRQGDVQVALVVAEIEVDFAAVGEDKDLAMSACCSACAEPWMRRLGTYSLGFMVPASTLRYGSTLMEETCWRISTARGTRQAGALILRPMVLSSSPVEEAVVVRVPSVQFRACAGLLGRHTYDALAHVSCSPLPAGARVLMLTFPTPLMTPPDTSTYFMAACSARGAVGEGEGREVERTADEIFERSARARRRRRLRALVGRWGPRASRDLAAWTALK